MITELLEKWKIKNKMIGCEMDEVIFFGFFREIFGDKSLMEITCDLAYAIHELEVCIDGLLEDMEDMSGQENQTSQEKNR
jgi:hypothetical protein